MVLIDYSSAQPEDKCAHGRVCCGLHPDHFTAVAAVVSPLGLRRWARGHGRRDAAVGSREGAGGRDRNAEALEHNDCRLMSE